MIRDMEAGLGRVIDPTSDIKELPEARLTIVTVFEVVEAR
jgi:hypothetical protein